MYLNPAEYVVFMFGGVAHTARAIGRDRTSVFMWKRSKNLGGGDGVIPTRMLKVILEKARELGLDITPADLIEGRELPSEVVHGESYQDESCEEGSETDSSTEEILF